MELGVGARVLAVDRHHEREPGGQVVDGGQRVADAGALGQLQLELAAPARALAQQGEETHADQHGPRVRLAPPWPPLPNTTSA